HQHLLANLPAHSAQVVCLETDSHLISAQPKDNPRSLATPDNLCYVIYTSGSTGKPKGVLVTHRALVNYSSAVSERLPRPTSFATVSTLAADLGHTAIYPALCFGAALHVISQERVMDPVALARYFDQHQVDCLKIVPSHLRALFNAEGGRVLPKSVVVVGGEATQWEWAQQWKESGCRVMNHYGPTECTVGVLTGEVGQEIETASREGLVPLGRPLCNTQIYVLDQQRNLMPVGVVGEIYIGGEGLARGYMRQPAQTAERFIPNPYSEVEGARLYRTGDLGRYNTDGNLEYVGRVDQQVKIRGFRIELGEIEAALNQHEGVSESVVTVQDEGQEKRLVAYVVSRDDQAVATSELRNHLRERLPEYMIPASFVFLAELPLTPNGKLDRKALPAADGSQTVMDHLFLSPRTPTEQVLALIWEKVLGLTQVGINDNFFELGGHSLLATQVVSRIREAFSQEIPVRQLFETPTLGALAAGIDEKLRLTSGLSGPALIARTRAIDQAQPLSFAQQRMWFINQLEPDNVAYNIPTEVTLKGELDVSALEQTINEVVRRHESLRTRFVSVDGQPMQLISPAETFSLPVLDLSEFSEEERKSRRERLANDEAQRPFDLAHDQLWRAHLLRLSADEHVLLFVMHHIISDGWSFSVLTNEIATLYGAFAAGEPSPLAELKLQYADFAIWQRELLQGQVLDEQLTYWKQQLAGAPEILELPLDRPRPPVQKGHGATQSFVLSDKLSDELRGLSRREGASLFMTLLSAFQALLYRYSSQTDIIVGTPIANRNRGETEGLIGFFVNGLAIRAEVDGNESFRTLLDQVRRVSLEAYTHQDLPFEKVVEELRPERSLSYNPLFQVVFALRNVPPRSLELPGLTIIAREIETDTTKFDIRLKIDETTDALTGTWQYNTDLFDAATIRRMQGHFQTLLGSIVRDPEQNISELTMLSADERHQLLAEASSVQQRQHDQCIHQLFEAQVEAAPDAIALTFADVQLSYGELNQRANQLAHHLRSLGVGPEVLVGICVERSVELVVGVLGIIKAGGAYVPLDPAYPTERLALILEDARVSMLLTQQSLLHSLPSSGAKPICLDSDWEVISNHDSKNPVNLNTADNLLYVIYTSGSTGKPKGVLVSHANVSRLFSSTQPWFQFNRNDVWTMFHSYAFDFSVWELWGALIRGGRLVVVPYLTSRSPESFYGLLSKEGVTVLNQTPSAFRQLITAEENAGGDRELSLRLVIFGGEALDLQNLRPWFDRHG
ncbi:MAG TPA: amino acid adenylation domain-containing protein, partial [Pyrinomonadaceae bacterium]|nr:amino acid adenylation domain-containing protein [Pyrinomonadaceae bacterium]